MNVGVKEYCKFFDVEVGTIGTAKVNLNKNYGNLHLSIPLYNTDLNYGGLNLSLNFSLSSIGKLHHFGKGFKLNYFQQISSDSYPTSCTITDSLGSVTNHIMGEYNKETGIMYLPYDGSDGCFKLTDLNGITYTYEWYDPNMGFAYPDSISSPGQSSINISKDSNFMYINSTEKAKFHFVNNKISIIEITENNILKSKITIDYNSNDYITYIKYYNHNNIIIKEVSFNIDIDNEIIIIMDVINHILHKYYYSNNSIVNKVEAYINNEKISLNEIQYFDNYSIITDVRGRKSYTYFSDNKPIYDIDYRGRIQSYKYNEDKKLLKKSDLNYNSYNASSLYNLVKNGYFINDKTYWSLNGVTGWSANIYPVGSIEPFTTALGTNCININNLDVTSSTSISQVIYNGGKRDDEITFILWAKNLTASSTIGSPLVNLKFRKSSLIVNELSTTLTNYDSSLDLWEYQTINLNALDDYDSIEIKIITPAGVSYIYAGIQLYKKNFDTLYFYNDNGTIKNFKKGKTTKTYEYDKLNKIKEIYISNLYDKKRVFNNKGQLIKENSNNGAEVNYTYDSKNRNLDTIIKLNNKYMKSSAKYDLFVDSNHYKNEFTSERFEKTQSIIELNSKNVIQSIDEKGNITHFNYDVFDNLDYMHMTLNNEQFSIDYDYEENRIIKRYTAENGINYTFTYDEIDRLLSVDIIHAYEEGGPSSGEIFNNVRIDYFDFMQDAIKSKTYGGFGDKYLFEYDEFDRISKVYHKAKNSTQEVLKCEYHYDYLDRLDNLTDYVDDEVILKEYEYNVKNQVISISEKRNNIMIYKKNLQYDNNDKVINEIYEKLITHKTIQQFDRVDDYSNSLIDVYCMDFKYKNPKILSCFFSEEEYDTELNDIVFSKDLTSYSINEGGQVNKNSIKPVYGDNLKVANRSSKPYNWINLDDNSDNLGYKFFLGPQETDDVFKTIGFYFYVGSIIQNYDKYLISIGDDESINYLGVYIDQNGKFCLKVRDRYSNEELKTSNKSLNLGWNFIALNYRVYQELGQGFPRSSCYELYANDEKLVIFGERETERYISLSFDTVISLGCQRLIGEKKNNFFGIITTLLITHDYYINDIEKYKEDLYNNIINYDDNNLLYINENLETITADSTTIFSPEAKFGLNYINLNNTLNSYNGLTPYIFTYNSDHTKRIFTINKETKRDTYNAYGAKLAYKFGISKYGAIAMRCYISKTSNNAQYLIENYDGLTEKLSLFRDKTNNHLIIQYGDINFDDYYKGTGLINYEDTGLILENNAWKLVSLSWQTTVLSQSESAFSIFFTVKCGDSSYSNRINVSYTYSNMTSYIGINKDGIYPLYGQIEMLTYSSNYCSVLTTNNYLSNLDLISMANEYDGFELLKKTSVSKYGNNLLNYEYQYKEIGEATGDIRIIPDVNKLKIYNNNFQTNYSYLYDKNGNIENVYLNELIKYNYIYDNLNRLKYEYDNLNNYSTNYTYDSNGNILYKNVVNSNRTNYTFKYDNFIKDRLMSIEKKGDIDDDIYNFEYGDALYGNPTFFGTGQGDNRTGIFYTWEGRRLVNYNDNINNLNIQYKYDSQSLRTSKIVNNHRINYIYDGDKLIAEIDTTNSQNNKYFIYDESNKLISIKYNGTNYYYVRELTGNIIKLVDDVGNIVVEYEYDAFGNVLNMFGTMKDSLGHANPFIYKGYYYDFETSLYYCNSRYYNPEWGRWLNADDVSYLDPSSVNGLNLYAYCNNNPVMFVDPNGNLAFLTLLLIGAAVGTVIGGGASTVTQLIENDWDWSEVNWGVVAVDAVFGAIDGALSVTGMGLAGTMLANSLLSGAQSVIQDLVTGNTSNTINKMWTSMGIGMLTSFLPGGYNGKKMAGIFNTSTAYIVSSNSAKKVAMYQAKQKLVKKTILKQTAKYIGSTTVNDFGSWGLDLLIGW